MSLVGSLKDLPFSDILQILCLSRRSGTLYLGRDDSLAILYFRDGLVCGIDLPGEESPLVRGIRRARLVPPEVLEQAIKECRRASDSLLQILAAKAYLEPEQVKGVVLMEIRQIIRDLLSWTQGEFRFEIEGEEGSATGPAHRRTDPSLRGQTGPSREGTLLRIPEGMDPREILLEEMQAMGAESVHHFFLPNVAAPTAATDSAGPEAGAAMRGDGAPAVVLVDERAVYRELLSTAWRQEGFRVEVYTSPQAGYQRFALLSEAGAPVSLVTDLVVPETGGSGFAGGLELLIRARQEFPGARVILMSEGVDPTVEEAARSLGARAILQKPITLPADSDSLRDALEGLARTGARLLRREGSELEPAAGEEGSTETIRVVDQLSLLGALLGELRRPGAEMELPLLVLRLASEYFERGVLLEIADREARGLGGFDGGKQGGQVSRRVRGLTVALSPGSRIREVVLQKATARGPMDHPDEAKLLQHMGGKPAREGILLPLMSQDRVVAVLYGDNGESEASVGDTRGLEIFLGEVGWALEKFLARPGVVPAAPERAARKSA